MAYLLEEIGSPMVQLSINELVVIRRAVSIAYLECEKMLVHAVHDHDRKAWAQQKAEYARVLENLPKDPRP